MKNKAIMSNKNEVVLNHKQNIGQQLRVLEKRKTQNYSLFQINIDKFRYLWLATTPLERGGDPIIQKKKIFF